MDKSPEIADVPDRLKDTKLSPRELSCIRLLGLGATDKQAALELRISMKTVEYHLARSRMKLHIDSRPELVRYAVDSGLVKKGERFVSKDEKPPPTTTPVMALLPTGNIVNALISAADRVNAKLNTGDCDPVLIDSLVKLADSLVNVGHFQLQLEDRRLVVSWLDGMKRIVNGNGKDK